ncbi:pPIWI_RE module domain-containing protein [Herbaspirillum seropedicae]|uniref:pPIWI_RE module domain-containing protein n=1 Tax=Herbaspirillum seropedicae TaxID=964 RepID=UPI003F8D3701
MAAEFEHIAMALQFDNTGSPLSTELVSVGWTDKAAETLNWIANQAVKTLRKSKEDASLHLPFVSLWARFQLTQPQWISLSRDLGMGRISKSNGPKALVFGYLHMPQMLAPELNDVVARWIDGPLTHYIQKFEVSLDALQRMRELVSSNQLLTTSASEVQLFPWGVASSGAPSVYQVTAGEIARLLAGKELFPELGPMMRVIDTPDSNSAELMTRPISVGTDTFSLVCKLSIQTLPGSKQPLIFLNFTRRRWATSLVANPFRAKRVGGFAYSSIRNPELAFRFDLDFDYKTSSWTSTQAYTEIELALGLEHGYANEHIVRYPRTADTGALIMHVAGLAEAKGSMIKAGVAIADQLAAYRNIVHLLKPIGFKQLSNFSEVTRKAPKLPRISVIRSQVVLSKLLSQTDMDEEELDELPTLQRIEQDVVALTKRSLGDWFGKKTPTLDRRYGNLAGVVNDLVKRSGIDSETERRTLYILVQSTTEKQWIEAVVRLMLGDSVNLIVGELPRNVHGHSSQLPNSSDSKPVRMAARMQAWNAFAKSNRFAPNPMFLIQADDWYDVNGRRMPDDSVNKIAARRALASELGATVQYLLPARAQKLDNYLMRLQAAILDLVYGHSGIMLGLANAAAAAFADPRTCPKQVVAIGSLQVTMGDYLGTIVAATRVDSTTGRPQIRLAHAEAEPIYTPWMRFEEALAYVAKRSSLRIPAQKEAAAFYQKFIGEVLDDAAAIDPHAVVFIESTRSAGLWKRLADKNCEFGKQTLDSEQSTRQHWGNLRIIRVREQAPTMVNLRTLDHALENGERLRVSTSVQRLFAVSDATAPTYWSFGPPIGQHKRGASCYRPMMLPDQKGGAKLFSPDYGQHQTPRGTEFVILQAGPGDDLHRLATYCEMLRVGVPQARGDIWVKVPSPLYAIEKLEDYMRY